MLWQKQNGKLKNERKSPLQSIKIVIKKKKNPIVKIISNTKKRKTKGTEKQKEAHWNSKELVGRPIAKQKR